MSLVYITEDRVRELLNWQETIAAVEHSMAAVSKGTAIQSARSITRFSKNILFVMPGYLDDGDAGKKALACKLVSFFPENKSLPTISANIVLLDENNGQMKAVIAGTEITAWRTAAASAVATKHLHRFDKKILAIMGAGTQGMIHAKAFRYYFNFDQIRIWNRTFSRAQQLVDNLNGDSGNTFVACQSAEECVKDADVVVTATTAEVVVVKYKWLKKNAHVNAIGVGNAFELDDEAYRSGDVYVDHWEGARSELKPLEDLGVTFRGQVGDVITGSLPLPAATDRLTIFQSLGMAAEDCAMARMLYDLHTGKL